MRRAPAFEIHGPAAVGLARVPGNEIKFTFTADDGRLGLHGNGSWIKKGLFFL